MRKLALVLAATIAGVSTPALATKPINPPTLHGFCSLGNVCVDNGTNTPTPVNPPQSSLSPPAVSPQAEPCGSTSSFRIRSTSR